MIGRRIHETMRVQSFFWIWRTFLKWKKNKWKVLFLLGRKTNSRLANSTRAGPLLSVRQVRMPSSTSSNPAGCRKTSRSWRGDTRARDRLFLHFRPFAGNSDGQETGRRRARLRSVRASWFDLLAKNSATILLIVLDSQSASWPVEYKLAIDIAGQSRQEKTDQAVLLSLSSK